MKKAELTAMKNRVLAKREKASDLDVILSEMMKLPYGQLKKVLTEEVLTVLEKYGYGQ